MGGTHFPIPAMADVRLADILRAISDPGRVQMIMVLSDGRLHPCSVDSFPLAVQKSTLSHHFKVLREAGITETVIDGRNYGVRLRGAELDGRFPGLIASLTSPEAVADLAGVSMDGQRK
jgi:DNA-binding transcriptional ArsR family regulator